MAIKFKKKCARCRKNFVLTTSRDRYPLCYECEKSELDQEIEDPEMKKLFDIPEEFYRKNSFLRDIKRNYLRFENLTDKQIAAFKKTVERMKKEQG
ncbi:hypothetical protein GF351_04455 [Candidatus Woesearchaeota archaeon]|nr:hypothetical protein [Candidatus Woesearchaeota archaeon]